MWPFLDTHSDAEANDPLYHNNLPGWIRAGGDISADPALLNQYGAGPAAQQQSNQWQSSAYGMADQARNAQAPQAGNPYLTSALQGSMMGQGQSVAQHQLEGSYNQAMNDQLSLAHTVGGGQLARVAAMRNAAMQRDQMQSQYGVQSALLGAQDMAQARDQSVQQAALQAQAESAQRQLNANREAAYMGLGNQVRTEVQNRATGVLNNIAGFSATQADRDARQKAADDARKQGLLGAGLSAAGAGLGGILGGPAGAIGGGAAGNALGSWMGA